MRGEHFSTESLWCKEPKKGVREMAVGGVMVMKRTVDIQTRCL